MEKAEAREQVRRRLEALTPERRRDASARIRKLVADLSELQRAETVMLFVSLPDEVYTLPIITDAMAAGKRVVLPKVDRKRKVMDARLLRDVEHDLVPGVFGIPEPRDAEIVAPAEVDLVLVPARGFDRQGNRLGRGGGYYDHYMAQSGFHATRCGIAFAAQVLDEIPHTPHDLPVEVLITEEGVLTCPTPLP